MVVSLRVVLDQLTQHADADLAEAELQIARALIAAAPSGCQVAAIVPAGDEDAAEGIDGLAEVTKAPLARSRLVASWQLGVAPGIGGGLIHAPSLVAPLVRHDRVNENDQTVVSLWDLRPWERPDSLPKAALLTQRALLRRAEKHADAVVVPTHAMAERLAEQSRLAGRIRVIPGAAPAGFSAPTDAVGRRRALGVPDEVVVVAGGDDEAVTAGLAAAVTVDHTVAVLDVEDARSPRVHELAAAAGVAESSLRVLGRLDAADRAAVLDAAAVLLAPSTVSAFPWRVVEALALGVPVVAAASDVHREILVDDGLYVAPEDLGDALASVLGSAESLHRFAVRARDRGRAFSWRDHAERVWALHAEL